MRVSLESTARPAKSRRISVGDRVSFEGDVLRVLDSGSLLIMVKANGAKLTVGPDWFEKGEKLRGGDKCQLTGTVTRVGESISDDFTPVSIAVDGYTATRVTVGQKWVSRLR